MKKKFLKPTAILLAIVMLTLLIPFSTATAAEPTSGYFDDYDTQTIFEITSISDWLAVSADTKTFAEKTVKLSADIDAGNTELPVLFAAATGFAGTFDGQDFTIKNATATGLSLIASNLAAGAVIKDLNLEKIALTSTATGSVYGCGLVAGNILGTSSMTGVTLTECSVTDAIHWAGVMVGGVRNNGTVFTMEDCQLIDCTGSFRYMAGGLIGALSAVSATVVRNCSVIGGTLTNNAIGGITNAHSVAAVVGRMNNGPTLEVYGCIVRDVVITGTRQVAPVLGSSSGNNSVTVRNTEIDCTVISVGNDGGVTAGGVIGTLQINSSYFGIIENVNVKITVEQRAAGGLLAEGSGGVIGTYIPAGGATLTVKNCNIEGTITAAKANVGGVIGYSSVAGITGAQTIENCYIDLIITSTANQTNDGTAMLIGYWGAQNLESAHVLTVKNVVVAGSVGRDNRYCVSAMIGFFGYAKTTVNFENCLILTEFPLNVGKTDATMNGSHFFGRIQGSDTTINTVNSSSVHENTIHRMIQNITTLTAPAGVTINGKPLTVRYTYYNDDSVIFGLDGDMAEALVKYENGFVKRVRGNISAEFIQDTTTGKEALAAGEKYTIRFIALSLVSDYTEAGFNITVKNTATGEVVKTFFTDKCEAYDRLTGNVEGTIQSYDAKDFDTDKFIALSITNIPAGVAYTFEFTPYYVTAGGITVNGNTAAVNYSAGGQLITD